MGEGCYVPADCSPEPAYCHSVLRNSTGASTPRLVLQPAAGTLGSLPSLCSRCSLSSLETHSLTTYTVRLASINSFASDSDSRTPHWRRGWDRRGPKHVASARSDCVSKTPWIHSSAQEPRSSSTSRRQWQPCCLQPPSANSLRPSLRPGLFTWNAWNSSSKRTTLRRTTRSALCCAVYAVSTRMLCCARFAHLRHRQKRRSRTSSRS